MTIPDAIRKLATDRVVDNRVYTDPDVYQREIEGIFERVWLFACHESEIRDVGAFVTLTIADTPVIVVRGDDGVVRAHCNTCRHRGSLVVDEPSGRCSAFRCPYHFWVYSLDGNLVNIPGEEAYDGTGFVKEDFPLIPVRCEAIFGLVFVNLDDGAERLTDWLGPSLVEVLRNPLGNADYEVLTTYRDDLAVNWKVFAENARDGYHVPFVHPFFRKASPAGEYHLFEHSHAVQYLRMDPDGIEPDLWAQLRLHPLPGVEVGEGYIVNIFPDIAVTVRSNVVSIDFQRVYGPRELTMENRTLGLVGDSLEMHKTRVLSQQVWFKDPVEKEDYPIFARQQRGVASRKVRHSIVARGADARVGTRGDDNRLRHFWFEWRARLQVEVNSLESSG